MEFADRENYLKANIVKFAEESFPDNLGLQWIVHDFEHNDDLTCVELEPKPLGMAAFRYQLVFTFLRPAAPEVVACYELDREGWSMLFDDGSGRGLPHSKPHKA